MLWMEKGEGTAGRRGDLSSLPLLLWRSLSSADHYNAATLPRKLFNRCSGQRGRRPRLPPPVSVPHQLVTKGEDRRFFFFFEGEGGRSGTFSLLLLSLTS